MLSICYCGWKKPIHKLIGSFSHYFQGSIHPQWLFGISSINTIMYILPYSGSVCSCYQANYSDAFRRLVTCKNGGESRIPGIPLDRFRSRKIIRLRCWPRWPRQNPWVFHQKSPGSRNLFCSAMLVWVVVSNMFFFIPIWGRFPIFKGVETTNQQHFACPWVLESMFRSIQVATGEATRP